MNEQNTREFNKWNGTRPVQEGDVIIVGMDDSDDCYGRVTSLEDGKIYFRFVDKHGVDDPKANEDATSEYYVRRIFPFADPIPNRWIAAFAPVVPLPFDESVDSRDAKILELEARIAKLEQALSKLERRANRDDDFEDWKTSRSADNGTFW